MSIEEKLRKLANKMEANNMVINLLSTQMVKLMGSNAEIIAKMADIIIKREQELQDKINSN